jgi:lipopolysaccharide/colanic/teichoic acid biosynthesis glycosyltransferase
MKMIAWIIYRNMNFKQDAGRGTRETVATIPRQWLFGQIIRKEKLGHALSLNAVVRYTQMAGN